MHPSHKRIWIPGLIILAALAAVIVWAFSTSSRVYAKPELAVQDPIRPAAGASANPSPTKR